MMASNRSMHTNSKFQKVCIYACVCLCVCVLLFLWGLDIWQLHFATTTFSSFWFYLCVIFRSTGREYWQSSCCRLPDGDDACWMTRTPTKGCVLEGWPFKEKRTHLRVQRWVWINPSVVSFHVEVMLSKSFGTRLPGWRRDGWMSGVIREYPCCWLNQTSWPLEIKLLCLHVRSWIKVEGSSLSGFRDQTGIFINLKTTHIMRSMCRGKLIHSLMCKSDVVNSHRLLKSTDQ